MLTWLLALLGSSFTFAIADILCDICITEDHHSQHSLVQTADDDDDATSDHHELLSDDHAEGSELLSERVSGERDDADESDAGSRDGGSMVDLLHAAAAPRRPPSAPDTAAAKVRVKGATAAVWTSGMPAARVEGGGTLSGEQDAAIAGLVTIVLVIVANLYWGIAARRAAAGGYAEPPRLRWGPFTHLQFWLAMIGGGMNFLHYYFLLKAFEGAPSTVLLPLVQVASVSVLFGSAALAALKSEPWITPTHALAYCLMFVGGVLPACGGHLAALFRPAFWRQPFVASAILAELALGMHDLMLSGCAYHADVVRNGGSSSPADAIIDGQAEVEPLSDDSYEYFIWSRVSFIATFAGMYSLSPRLWGQLVELFNGLVAPRYISLSALSEALTVLGFYLASIAYGLFYQAGVVHAAEASLSQLLNLMLAFLLLKCFGIGRESAVGSMPAKIASFVLITIGLFLCTLEETRTPAVASFRPAAQGVPFAITSMTMNSTALRALAALERMRL